MDGNLAESHKNGSYTYEDYLSWDDGERYELIDGYAYAMAAATPEHQVINLGLASEFRSFLKGKPCEVYQDIDVRLFPKEIKRNNLSLVQPDRVFRPDISVVCDPEQISPQGCDGAPALIAEVLSPSTAGYDQDEKFNCYLQAGVREYWIVSPVSRTVKRHVLHGEDYIVRSFCETDILTSERFPGLRIPLSEIFPNEDGKES